MSGGLATHLRVAPSRAACGLQMTAGTFRTEIPSRMIGRDGRELDADQIREAVKRIVTCRSCLRKL